MKLKKLKINNKFFNLYFKKGVFEPTATTIYLANTFNSINSKINNKNILDLGCGSGIISVLINDKLKKNRFYASDINTRSVDTTMKNFKKFKIVGEVKKGSMLHPWKNWKFNFIINDISGISSLLAKKSRWFKNVPANTGNDGTKLTIKIIKESKKYLVKNGKIYLPLISLSDTNKVLKISKQNFKKVKILNNFKWFLPTELEDSKKLLFRLKNKKKN